MSEFQRSGTHGNEGPSDEQVRDAIPLGAGGREFRVGIFVVIGIISFMVVLFLMTDPSTFRRRYLVVTVVEEAGGIRKGDPVQMKGVNIGRVHRFVLVPEGVAITLEVEGKWDIPSDSRTRLVSNGLLGGRAVDVIRGSLNDRVGSGSVLPGRSTEGIFDAAEALTGQAGSVLGRMEELLAPATVRSLSLGAQEFQELMESLADITEGQRDEINRLTNTLNEAARGLRDVTSEAGPEVTSVLARADSTMTRLQSTADILDSTVSSLRNILQGIERGEGTLGQLVNNDELYRNLNSAAENVNLLLADFRENPKKYISISLF